VKTKKSPKVYAIFIAYNAERTLKPFYKNFPKKYFNKLILVDDASTDRTYTIAKKLPNLLSYNNKKNLGYGGNLKRALKLALSGDADIIVDIHPDGEYKTSSIPEALKKISDGHEFVLGNRFSRDDRPWKTGMYFWKILPIMSLNLLHRAILGLPITDYHQGFRVYTKSMLEKINYNNNSNNYLFSFELLAQAAFHHIKTTQVPVETNYEGKKRGASFKNSIKYSMSTFPVVGYYLLAKLGYKTKLFAIKRKKQTREEKPNQ
jgi:glycosyltransferase involved in cell wall biosynthesis